MTRVPHSAAHSESASDQGAAFVASSSLGSPALQAMKQPFSPLEAAMSQQLLELSGDNNLTHEEEQGRRLSISQLGAAPTHSHSNHVAPLSGSLMGLPHPHLNLSSASVTLATPATSTTAAAYAAMFEDFDKQLGVGDVPAMYSHRLWLQPRDVNIVFGRDVIQVPLKIENTNNEYVNLALSHREFDVMAVHIPKYDSMPPTELLDEISRLLKEQIEKQKLKRSNVGLSNQLGDFLDSSATFQARILELEYELSRLKTKLAAARALQTTLTDENTVLRSNLREMEQRCVDNESLKMQNDVLREQSVASFTENARLKKLLRATHSELHALSSEVNSLRTQVHFERSEIAAQVDHSMNALIANVRDREHVLQESYLEEKKERQLIAEKYYEISGRIRVFCRMRPVTRSLHKPASSALLRPKPNSILVDRSGKEFSFDQVFGPENSQADVYAQMEPVVVSFADGYNACIMAYGQTGSGKTHTMVGGPGDAQGMIPRALQQVFTVVNARQLTYKDTLSVSMVEIYNDQILDLLTDGESGVKIKSETDISLRPVTLWEHVNAVLAEGNSNRNIASTSMNMESSRSHALVFLHLESQHRETLEIRKSTLCLVDLAGSERISRSQVEGERLKETQHINKSLSALGDVMHALQHKAKHVPYRNSKLTYMLRDMLSGQSKTLMMLQLSPEEDDIEETICSLQFGARVSQIQMGAVKTSVESGEIYKLKEENRTLEKKLAQLEEQASTLKQESRSKQEELKEVRDRNLKLQAEVGQQHDDLASLQEKLEAVTVASTSSASVSGTPPASPEKTGSRSAVPPSPTLSSQSVQSVRSVTSTSSAPAVISSPANYGSSKPTGVASRSITRPTRTATATAGTPTKTATATSRVSSSLARPSPRSVPKETATTTSTSTAATTAAERVARRKSLTTLNSPSTATVLAARERLARATNEPLTQANRRATLGAIGTSTSQPNLSAASPTASRLARTRPTGTTSSISPSTPTTATSRATTTAVRRTNSLASSRTSPASPSVGTMPSSAARSAAALEKRRALASSRSLPSTPTTTAATRARLAAKSAAVTASSDAV